MALKITLEDIKDKAIDLAQSGVAMSMQLAEIAKLKTSNLGEEDAIKKAYLEIGKLYYAERGMAPEGAYVALCEKITAAKTNIENNNARIEELRKKEAAAEAEVEFTAEDVVDADFVDMGEEVPAEGEAPAEAAPEAPVEEKKDETVQ